MPKKTNYLEMAHNAVAEILESLDVRDILENEGEDFKTWLLCHSLTDADYAKIADALAYKKAKLDDTITIDAIVTKQLETRSPETAYDNLHDAYEKYKAQWIKDHISAERQAETERRWKEYLENDFEPDIPGETCSFEDYIEEFGYSGEIYACFNEFVENDYHADA